MNTTITIKKIISFVSIFAFLGPKNLVMEDGHKALLGLIEARKEEEYDIPFPAEAIEKVKIL